MPLINNSIFLTGLVLCLQLFACGKDLVSPATDLEKESQHFVFSSNTDLASEAEIEQGIARAERLFQKISALVGQDLTPKKKIRVLLEGDFQDQGPYFDPEGIHLFRYSHEEGGYWSLIAHEMAHAFREAYYIEKESWTWPTFGFYDEGFAEFVAQQVDPQKTGFPFYGFPEDIVVGYLIQQNEYLPLAVLRQQHEALNQPCNLQTYPERASWMRYIDETYGRETLLETVYPVEAPTAVYLEDLLGISLVELDRAWETWMKDRYATIPNAETAAQAFRQRTSWAHLCKAGVDY